METKNLGECGKCGEEFRQGDRVVLLKDYRVKGKTSKKGGEIAYHTKCVMDWVNEGKSLDEKNGLVSFTGLMAGEPFEDISALREERE